MAGRLAAPAWRLGLFAGPDRVNGYPDGTFKPDAQVTYAEALAMILRALGYEPTLKGVWPAKYLVKAAELGITKGVTFSANVPATRGDVAALVDNSLTVAKVVQVGYGDQARYVVSGTDPNVQKTTLLDNLGATYVEGFLLSSPELFGVTDTIKVWKDDGDWAIETGELIELTLAGAQYSGLLGHKVRAWKNADGDVFSIEDLTAASDVKVAKVESGNKLTVGGTALTDTDLVPGGAFVVLNWQCDTSARKTKVTDAVYGGLYEAVQRADNGEVTLVYSGGKVLAAIGTQLTTRVVDSVSTGFQSIAFTSGGGTLSVKDKSVRYVGAASKLEEIQKDDVVEYTEATVGTKTYVYIVVTRNAKTGEFSRLVDGTPDKVTVAGVEYIGASGFDADANLLGKQVTVLLNKHGKVVAMKPVTADTKIIAAVKGDPYTVPTVAGNETYVRVLKADGTEARVKVADGATIVGPTTNLTFDVDTHVYSDLVAVGVKDLAIIEYSLNADGALSSAAVLVEARAATDTSYWQENLDVYKDYSQIEVTNNGSRALVVSSTAIFDVQSAGNPKVVSLARLMGDSGGLTGKVVPTAAGGVAKVVAIKGGFEAPAATTYGLVVGKYQASGPKYYLSINVNGAVTDYEVTVGRFVYNVDDVVMFNPADAKNTVTAATQLTASSGYTWKVQEIDSANKLVYIDEYSTSTGEENSAEMRRAILILADTQVFNLNGDNPATLARFEDIAVGQEVRVYYDAAAPGVAKVFVIVK